MTVSTSRLSLASLGVADEILLTAVLVGEVSLAGVSPFDFHEEPFGVDIVLLFALLLHLANVTAEVVNFLEFLNSFDLLDRRVDAFQVNLCLLKPPLLDQNHVLLHYLDCFDSQEVFHHLWISVELLQFLVRVHKRNDKVFSYCDWLFLAQRSNDCFGFEQYLVTIEVAYPFAVCRNIHLQHEILANARQELAELDVVLILDLVVDGYVTERLADFNVCKHSPKPTADYDVDLFCNDGEESSKAVCKGFIECFEFIDVKEITIAKVRNVLHQLGIVVRTITEGMN